MVIKLETAPVRDDVQLHYPLPAFFLKITHTDTKFSEIDASGSAWFFFVSERSNKKKSGGLGVNKRNRGYPADFEFIERTLSEMQEGQEESRQQSRFAF